MKNYKTSKDYKRLKGLLDNGHDIVCFITYDFCDHDPDPGQEPLMVTDVCLGRLTGGWYHFSARGIEYCAYWPEMKRFRSFEEMCENENLEFIEPDAL